MTMVVGMARDRIPGEMTRELALFSVLCKETLFLSPFADGGLEARRGVSTCLPRRLTGGYTGVSV